MEYDLKKNRMEDNLILTQLERRPQKKWKTTSKKIKNGRQPQKIQNERQPNCLLLKT
jgi:hypothetical protein